jgi:hypothetical protein
MCHCGYCPFSARTSQRTHSVSPYMTDRRNIYELFRWVFNRLFLEAYSNQSLNSSGCWHLVLLHCIKCQMLNCFFCLNAYFRENTLDNHENHDRYSTISGPSCCTPTTPVSLTRARCNRQTSLISDPSRTRTARQLLHEGSTISFASVHSSLETAAKAPWRPIWD